MHTALDCVLAFQMLLDTEYEIFLGRKGVLKKLTLRFEKTDCFHLMGLQHLTDRPQLKQNREKVFDDIFSGTMPVHIIESSDLYDTISERVDFLPLLEKLIDSNDTVFKYNEKANRFSAIQAEYLMKNMVGSRGVYIFLDTRDDETYYCRSFFPEGTTDYTRGQASWTLLRKTKRCRSTGVETVLYNKI